LVVYSPTVDHLMGIVKELKKYDFIDVRTVENIVREWKVDYTVRPKTMGIMHTGFLTFARKNK
jgi:tRNA A58 N-methylase Trm61